jgi:nicotinamide phosphoribosyltransferase
MFKQTALTSIDSYKLSHAEQYPVGITKVYSNFTPRSESHFNVPSEFKDGKIVWFGLQMFLQELNAVWKETFFDLAFDEVEKEALEFYAPFCGPNGFNVSRLEELHNLGYLPLEIKALPEGVRVPIGVPVLTITNTLPQFAWLPNFLETWMSCELWKSCTSATTSFVYRKILNKYQKLTGGFEGFVQWQSHDFSVRGMSGIYDAAKSGAGHLLSSTGTDNLPAVKLINDCYRGKETFVGGSVPATEHSVMCAGGKESEVETFRRLIKTYPSGVVSIVSDTWDFWNVITNTARELKDEILARVPDQFGLAKVVFRPDSGDPVKIICGDPEAEVGSPAFKGAVECLAEIFGTTTNDKGFKTLNQRVGLIYGDSITPQRADEILYRLAAKGFASDNIVFGVGSYTFQYQTRDTLGFAMKATYVEIEGVGQAIFKDPKTDSGTKKSAKGLLSVGKDNNDQFVLVDRCEQHVEKLGFLQTVYKDGKILVNDSFAEIRARLETYL